jgi:hypothetical protein
MRHKPNEQNCVNQQNERLYKEVAEIKKELQVRLERDSGREHIMVRVGRSINNSRNAS